MSTQNPTLSEREEIARDFYYATGKDRHGGPWINGQPENVCGAVIDSYISADIVLKIVAKHRAPVAPAETVAASEVELIGWRIKADLLRSRGQSNTLHDIRQAADYLQRAADLVSATPAQPSTVTAEGWKLAPLNPTPEMSLVGCATAGEDATYCLVANAAYRAMLAAAPSPPATSPVTGAMVEALAWYGENARLARLIHSEGDAGRYALAEDGGKRARAALAAQKAEG